MNPTQNPDAQAHDEQEVHKGSDAFGFFQRYQKLIVMTAGMFVLLTFSIPFALEGFFQNLGGPAKSYPVMNVPGVGKVMVDEEDQRVARWIRRVWFAGMGQGLVVSPMLRTGRTDNDLMDRISAVRALAVESGIDASFDDVDKAIQRALDLQSRIPNSPVKTAFDLARSVQQTGSPDLQLFRQQVREALRVGTFLRLTGLGAGSTRSEALVQLLKDHEQHSFEVAAFDGGARREELKKELKDKVLQDWLAELDESKADRFRKPANKAAIKVAALEHGTFDHKAFLPDLGDFQVSDDQVRDYYLANREQRYKLEAPKKKDGEKNGGEKPGDKEQEGKKEGDKEEGKDNGSADPLTPQDPPAGQKPAATGDTPPPPGQNPDEAPATQDPAGDPTAQDGYQKLDEALQAQIKNELYAQALLARWQGELDKRLAAHMAEVVTANMQAALSQETAEEKLAEAKAELETAKQDEKEAKQKAVDDAEKAVEAAKAAAKTAGEAVDARRKAFDFEPVIKELAKGRAGLKFVSVPEKTDAEGFKELPELGAWRDSHLPGQMSKSGEIYMGAVQATPKGSFIFQVTDIEERPFRAFEDIKDDLEDMYLTEKVEAEAKEKKEAFEKALEELSRAKLSKEVAELENEGKTEAAKKFSDWEAGIKKRVAELETEIAGLNKDLRRYARRSADLEKLKAELAKAEDKKKSLAEEVEEETEKKVDEKLAEVHKDVLVGAAKQAGVEVVKVGPHSKLLSSEPRFEHRHSDLVRAVFAAGSPALELDVGEVTALQSTNNMVWMALSKSQANARPDQISRRLWRGKVSGAGISFSGLRMSEAVAQSWSLDALKAGYGWQPAENVEPDSKQAPKDSAGSGGKTPEKPGSGDEGDKEK